MAILESKELRLLENQVRVLAHRARRTDPKLAADTYYAKALLKEIEDALVPMIEEIRSALGEK